MTRLYPNTPATGPPFVSPSLNVPHVSIKCGSVGVSDRCWDIPSTSSAAWQTQAINIHVDIFCKGEMSRKHCIHCSRPTIAQHSDLLLSACQKDSRPCEMKQQRTEEKSNAVQLLVEMSAPIISFGLNLIFFLCSCCGPVLRTSSSSAI